MAPVVLTKESSIADHFLSEIRDKSIQLDRRRFRENLEHLGSIMAYEISRKLQYESKVTETSLGKARGRTLRQSPVLIVMLRAGLPYYAGFQKVFGQSDAGFIGIQRVEGGASVGAAPVGVAPVGVAPVGVLHQRATSMPTIKTDYVATPHLEGRDVILVDPMLATGLSVTDTVARIQRNGTPGHIHLATLISTQAGIDQVESQLRIPHTIWTFAIDEKLNESFYIVPGLGDAGDLSFGEKL